MRRHLWLIPLAALIALLPMLIAGPSNGQDYVFHLSSWLGAEDQMRHGMLWPRWDFLAAYNAGEPRFVFYPPISWLTGALLSFVLPVGALPFAMAWIVMVIAGFAMHGLARRYASPGSAVVAACVYLANPWMLLTILTRCAYGELFAAAFCPWLLAAALEEDPQPSKIAVPMGLIWLSNVPGAILCSYLLGFVLIYRLATERRVALLRTFALGFALALAMDAVSLLPALHQRRYIDVEGAFPEGFRPIDNLVFFRTLPSDAFFLRVEHLALLILIAGIACLLVSKARVRAFLLTALLGIAFSLTFLAKPFWLHLPALWMVQFPWRASFLAATVAGLAVGLAWDRVSKSEWLGIVAGLVLVAGLASGETWAFHAPCPPEFTPVALEKKMVVDRHNGVPTNEYYSLDGDSELIRPDNPPFWQTKDPAEFASGTTPNLSAVSEDAKMPEAPAASRLVATPMRFTVNSASTGYLVINLQDYPNWEIRLNGALAQRVKRPDGLTVVAVPAGETEVTIRWRHTWDEILGLTVTLAAFAALLARRSMRFRR